MKMVLIAYCEAADVEIVRAIKETGIRGYTRVPCKEAKKLPEGEGSVIIFKNGLIIYPYKGQKKTKTNHTKPLEGASRHLVRV